MFARKAASEHAGDDEEAGEGNARQKTKKEVMMEIMAKSKSAKRERVKEKEADDEQLDALDLTFKALADVRATLRAARELAASDAPARRRRPARCGTACAPEQGT